MHADMERDRFFKPDEAAEYGLIDKVIPALSRLMGGPHRLQRLELRSWRARSTPRRCRRRAGSSTTRRSSAPSRSTRPSTASPRRDAVARWVEQTPPDFVFAVKAVAYLTHMKRLTDMERGVERLYEPLQPLIDAGRLGPVLWQLPEALPPRRRAARRRAGPAAAGPPRVRAAPPVVVRPGRLRAAARARRRVRQRRTARAPACPATS